MYIIIWEYHVRAEELVAFEKTYTSHRARAQLLRKADGYRSTELIRDSNQPQRYITIDRWTSPEDYESFRSQWKSESARLAAPCEGLTEQETLLGK